MQMTLLPIRAMFSVLNTLAPSLSGKMAQRFYTMPPRKIKPPTAEEKDFFAHAESFVVPYPSHPLRAWRLGPRDAKPVLLVHGWGGNPSIFVPLANRLVAQGFQVICYEAPGHGQHPEQYTSPMGFADSVHAVLDAVGPVHAIVGHSLAGGAIVMASKRGLKTDRLVLLSPLTRVIDHTDNFAAQLGISAKAIAHMRKLVWDYAEPSSSRYGSDWDGLYTAPDRYQTLIVHDEHDRFVPFKNAEWLQRQWPRSTLIKTAGVSHGRIAKDTAVMNAVCDFVSDQEMPSAAGCARPPSHAMRPRKNKGNTLNTNWIDLMRLSKRAARFKTGWPARSRAGIGFYELPQATVRARIAGTPVAGQPTIVLVCDPPNVIEHFDQLIGLLEPHARVICFEPPGFGFSPPKKNFKFSFDDYRASIDDLLEKLGEGPYLLAFTCVWAHIALQIAANKPASVAKLMLWQSPAWEEQVKWARHVDANHILSTPVLGQLAMALAPRSIGVSWHKSSMAKGRYPDFTPPLQEALEHGSFCCLGSLWQHFYDHAPPPVQISQPVLVTWGTADRTHRGSDKLSISRQVPHAVWHEFFDGAGHSPELEISAAFSRLLLDWMKKDIVPVMPITPIKQAMQG